MKQIKKTIPVKGRSDVRKWYYFGPLPEIGSSLVYLFKGTLAFKLVNVGVHLIATVFEVQKFSEGWDDFLNSSTTTYGKSYDLLVLIQSGLNIFASLVSSVETANKIYEIKPNLKNIMKTLEKSKFIKYLPFVIMSIYFGEFFIGLINIQNL